ncbi:hypothetical protein PYW07_002052 [Mythimna separata]|uniref:Uncharacterized protein n=1 Tax=Mythimna separata TaxID=271217 RepID=A0AAD7YLK9_MYTSE|nr:hypothetical protein PYW07_002052 [Mythimna separata]
MQWSVHGIWPRDVEKKYYPEFCNNSWAFDPEQIKSIEDELEQVWPNIHKETDRYSFWEHEWTKHGTCATGLQPFDSQFKYFSKGIEWSKKYPYIMDTLNSAGIFPDDTKKFKAEEFAAAVKARTKKDPMISCLPVDGVTYLEEIHLCFDKQLNLIDCDTVTNEHCDIADGIIYPANA